MLDSTLRPLKDAIFRPLTRPVPRFISPTFITVLAFAAGLASCYHATRLNTPYSVAFWVANRFFDCLDGSLARRRSKSTDLGAFLDVLGDFIVYSLIPIACALGVAEGPRGKFTGLGLGVLDTPWVRSIVSNTRLEASRTTTGTSFWVSIAAVEASFHINNFVLFFIAAVLEKRRAMDDEEGAEDLMLVAARPALVEGFESGIIFTLMLAAPGRLELLCWSMTALVGIGILQRVAWVIGALTRDTEREKRKSR